MYSQGEVCDVLYQFVTKQLYRDFLKGGLAIYLFDVFIPVASYL